MRTDFKPDIDRHSSKASIFKDISDKIEAWQPHDEDDKLSIEFTLDGYDVFVEVAVSNWKETPYYQEGEKQTAIEYDISLDDVSIGYYDDIDDDMTADIEKMLKKKFDPNHK